jgi:hypothetical protein
MEVVFLGMAGVAAIFTIIAAIVCMIAVGVCIAFFLVRTYEIKCIR